MGTVGEDLAGRVVLITGASRGLGLALARGFLSHGANVAVPGRNDFPPDCFALHPDKVFYRRCDFRVPSEIPECIDHVVGRWGRIDVLINNAASLGIREEISSYPPGVWEEVLETNLTAPFLLARAVIPVMRNTGSGSIINVGSSAGVKGRSRWGAYAVSKFGLEGLTQILADELRAFGIRANLVDPGAMATDMRRKAYPLEDQSTLRSPDEILDVFYYLASARSADVTGARFVAAEYSLTGRAIEGK